MQVRYTVHLMTLSITELFRSIQGETSWSGLPTFFVQLSACNLRCRWCDTPYSFSRGETLAIEAIITSIEESGCRHVCITGGEPLLQKKVHILITQLLDAGYHVSIETGGSLSTQEIDSRAKVILDLKCPGSEMVHKNDWENIKRLKSFDEVKFVIADRVDYDWVKRICTEHRLWGRELLFSPVHNELDPKVLTDWILTDKLPVRLNLQIHKYIWGAAVMGV